MANTISAVAENIQFFGTEVLVQLRNALSLIGFVNRNYDGAAVAPGSIINIPAVAISGNARTRTINGAVVTDNVNANDVQVTMTQIYKSVAVDNLQRTFSNIDMMMEMGKRLAIIMANGADSLLTGLWSQIPYEVGTTDGSAVFSSTAKLNALAAARRQLMVNQAPTDRLQGVFGPTEAYNIRTLDLFNQAQQWGDPNARQTGDLGRVAGFNLRESQSNPSSVTLTTAAAWGTPTVNGAVAIGATSLVLAGLGTGTIKAGSIFVHTASGVNYVVTADATITAGAATVTISPAVKVAISNGDALSLTNAVGGGSYAHSAAGSVGFAYDPDAFLFVTRPQAEFVPGSGVASYRFSDPESGLSFRLHIQSQVAGIAGTAMQEALTADLLCGAALVRPELACRVIGQV